MNRTRAEFDRSTLVMASLVVVFMCLVAVAQHARIEESKRWEGSTGCASWDTCPRQVEP